MWNLLMQIVVLLGVCLVFGSIFSRLKQSPLVGYLLAGMVLGEGSLGLVDPDNINAIAELGVALLLFSLGLEFSWQRLKGLGSSLLLGGAAQVVITNAVVALIAMLFGLPWKESVIVGGMLALSSTAAVLRILSDRAEIDAVHGRGSLAVLLVQDVAVVPLAVGVTLLAGEGSTREIAVDVLKILGMAAGLILGLFILLNVVAARVVGLLTLERNRELTMLLAVVVGLGSTALAHEAGLSPALGAFVAGMFLGSSRFATQVRGDVSSLRIILLTLFFGAAGMVADPIWIIKNFHYVGLLAVAVIAGKTIIIALIARATGRPWSTGIAVGLCLGQIGEFAFVLGSAAKAATQADGQGLIQEDTYKMIVSTAIVTLIATPYLVTYAPAFGRRAQRLLLRGKSGPAVAHSAEEKFHPDAVLIGFGPSGQAVGRALHDTGRKVLVIDLNEKSLQAAEQLGLHTQLGDATMEEVLEHAHVHVAKLVVITVPARSAAIAALHAVRCQNDHARIIVRSRYEMHTEEFSRAGAHDVIGDEHEVGRRLSRKALQVFDG